MANNKEVQGRYYMIKIDQYPDSPKYTPVRATGFELREYPRTPLKPRTKGRVMNKRKRTNTDDSTTKHVKQSDETEDSRPIVEIFPADWEDNDQHKYIHTGNGQQGEVKHETTGLTKPGLREQSDADEEDGRD